jgi:hypothetical protein
VDWVSSKVKMEITKELSVVKTQVSKAILVSQQLQIKVKEDLIKATDVLSKIKTIGKLIKEKKEGITKPLNEALNNARELFKPIEAQWLEAENIVKNKILEFEKIESERVVKQEQKIVDKVDNGEISFDKASEKIKNLQLFRRIENKIEGKVGEIQFRVIKKVIIKDASKLPREYLIPDEVKIRKDALDGKDISGVEVVEEKIIASK